MRLAPTHLALPRYVDMPYCKLCDKEFRSWPHLQQHKEAKHNHHSAACDRRYKSQLALDDHDKAVHPDWCNDCQRHLPSKDALNKHLQNDHSFHCITCDKQLRSGCGFREHSKTKGHISLLELTTVSASLPAPMAPDTTSASSNIAPQTLGGPSIQCPICSTECSDASALQHLQLHLTVAHTPPSPQCTFCDGKFKSENHLQKHISYQHTLQCEECVEVLRNGEEYKLHMKESHEFRCTKCPAVFSKKRNFESHFVTHNLQCGKCSYSPGCWKELFKHMNENHKFNCFEKGCPMSCETMESLDRHIAVQHAKCTQCGEQFESSLHLLAHMEGIHGFKFIPYCRDSHKCQKCPESYETSEGLVQHSLKTHMPTCDNCGGAFPTDADLKVHKEDVHRYLCLTCPETFVSRDRLQKHELTHRFICHQFQRAGKPCTRFFNNEKELSDHIFTGHILPELNMSSQKVVSPAAKALRPSVASTPPATPTPASDSLRHLRPSAIKPSDSSSNDGGKWEKVDDDTFGR